MTAKVNYRDASTGEYVTKEYAIRHPDTTVAEIVPEEEWDGEEEWPDNDTEEYDTLGGED